MDFGCKLLAYLKETPTKQMTQSNLASTSLCEENHHGGKQILFIGSANIRRSGACQLFPSK